MYVIVIMHVHIKQVPTMYNYVLYGCPSGSIISIRYYIIKHNYIVFNMICIAVQL